MNITLDPRYVWRRLAPANLRYPTSEDIGNQQGSDQQDRTLLTCHTCSMVVLGGGRDNVRCPRCGAMVHHRKPRSLSRSWALLLAAVILYVPANVFPIMTVTYLGRAEADTILGRQRAGPGRGVANCHRCLYGKHSGANHQNPAVGMGLYCDRLGVVWSTQGAHIDLSYHGADRAMVDG